MNTLFGNNELTKFSDNSTLLVPEKTDVSVATEFRHIEGLQDWAKDNSMVINLVKSKEIVFCNPRAIPTFIPSPIFGIERVLSVKLLGVYTPENSSCEMHFKHIINVSSQILHMLKTLKRQGLRLLHCVFHAIILNKIMYAISQHGIVF